MPWACHRAVMKPVQEGPVNVKTFLASASHFTYASPEDAPWRRALIRAIEQVTGKPRLRRLYADCCRGPAAG